MAVLGDGVGVHDDHQVHQAGDQCQGSTALVEGGQWRGQLERGGHQAGEQRAGIFTFYELKKNCIALSIQLASSKTSYLPSINRRILLL